jgi:predicted kinase
MSTIADAVTAAVLPQIAAYKDVPHPKCVICFAAVPGSGKTWLSEKLEQDLQAIMISNDDIRRAIDAVGVSDRNTRERIKEAVIRRVNKQVVTWSNGLLILDADVSRRYAKMLPRFPGYKIIVISIDAPKELLIERIRTREGHRADPERTIELLDKWLDDKQQFMADFGSAVTFQVDAEQGIDYESLKKAIISEVKP